MNPELLAMAFSMSSDRGRPVTARARNSPSAWTSLRKAGRRGRPDFHDRCGIRSPAMAWTGLARVRRNAASAVTEECNSRDPSENCEDKNIEDDEESGVVTSGSAS